MRRISNQSVEKLLMDEFTPVYVRHRHRSADIQRPGTWTLRSFFPLAHRCGIMLEVLRT